MEAEFNATVAWFNKADNPNPVSAHAVVGPGGRVARPVDPTLIAWHAREYNRHHLGIELTQPHQGDPIPSDVLDAAAKVIAEWHQQFGFPLQFDQINGLAEHFEIPPGIRDGKSDIKLPFDRDDFLVRVRAAAGHPPTLQSLLAANPNLGQQLAEWQSERERNGEDPHDYGAFRKHEIDILAPDPGPVEFGGFRN
jgi:hypothetical protein